MNELIFFYGTLWTKTAQPQMNALVRRVCEPLEPASFQGRLFLVRDYPGAIASPDTRDQVSGMLYRVREPQRWIVRFDRYENFDPDHPMDSEYLRTEVTVTGQDSGNRLTAWTYLYNRNPRFLKRIPNGNYARFLNQPSSHEL